MVYTVPIDDARAKFPEYEFVAALTPSVQKAAFHVRGSDGRDLCLKLISPDYSVDRLNREIEALRRVSHPNVVGLIEYTFSSRQDQSRHFIVEEFVEGSDLADALTGTPWTIAKAAPFFAALASGLEALRAAGIVHRDLKPQNIRVRVDGEPAIIDFGLARHLDLPDLTATSVGAGIGTPAYFAPEQFEGNKRDIDHRTDLFALGVVLYEALVGEHPFLTHGRTTVAELAKAVCGGSESMNQTKLRELPAPWPLIVAKLLSKDRIDRPARADVVAQLIRRAAGLASGGAV